MSALEQFLFQLSDSLRQFEIMAPMRGHSYPLTGSRKTGAAAIKRATTKARNRKRAKRKGGAA